MATRPLVWVDRGGIDVGWLGELRFARARATGQSLQSINRCVVLRGARAGWAGARAGNKVVRAGRTDARTGVGSEVSLRPAGLRSAHLRRHYGHRTRIV